MSKTILVVEPSVYRRADLASAMVAAGWSALTVGSVDDALHHIRSGPDVLITEIDLANEITGWQLANVFRANDPMIGVIYTSRDVSRLEQRVVGGLFFPKPYELANIVDGCRLLMLEKEEAKLQFR